MLPREAFKRVPIFDRGTLTFYVNTPLNTPTGVVVTKQVPINTNLSLWDDDDDCDLLFFSRKQTELISYTFLKVS